MLLYNSEMMTISKIKETVAGILLGGLLTIVPFYFETKAMTEENQLVNSKQQIELISLSEQATEIKVDQAVEKAEIEHNKEILLRIEKKLDELRQEVRSLD